jgi:hypothetical protein
MRAMPAIWTVDDIARIGSADELRIAVQSPDGTLRNWVPIWVVSVGEQVYVRTWYRRDNGWFGQVVDTARARIRVPGLEITVTVDDVGSDLASEVRRSIDTAYLAQYGRFGGATVDRMVTDEAAATTLRLTPEPGH